MDKPLKKIGEYFIYESDILGKGPYGKVYKGYHENDPSKLLAIKQINVQIMPESYFDGFKAIDEKEGNCLQNLDHPHIIKLYGVTMTRYNLYLATELCPDGNFSKIMGKVPIETLLVYFKQIIQALVYAKSIGAIHRDIKPENILMKDNVAKVCDFGFSKLVDEPNVKSRMTKVGTPLYMAPEVFGDELYSCQCDVWSCGVMLYQMIYSQTPWTGINQYDLFDNIKKEPLKFPPKKDVDDKLKDLIGRMLNLDQDKRISLEQVLKHESMINIDETNSSQVKKEKEEELKNESNLKKKKVEEVKNESISKRKQENKEEDDKKVGWSTKMPKDEEKKKDSNIKQQKSNVPYNEDAKGASLNPKKNKPKEEIPKYILYLEHKTDFFNSLSDRLLDYKEDLNLSGDIRKQMRILFKKIALICAKRIKKILSLKKKEKMSEIKQISINIFESGILKNLKSKYEEFLEKQETSYQETLEDYKKSMKKFPPSFMENVVNYDSDEINSDFIKEHKRIFDGLKDEIDEKIEDLDKLDGEEHNEVFKTIYSLIKVRRGGKLDEDFEFNEDDDIDSFEEFNKQIEKWKGNKAKEKSLKQLRSLINY